MSTENKIVCAIIVLMAVGLALMVVGLLEVHEGAAWLLGVFGFGLLILASRMLVQAADRKDWR